MKKLFTVLACTIIVASLNTIYAQSGYEFNDEIDLDVSSVKNQYRSGTCWSFAAISFLEAELIRTGKGEMDLSEMYLVRHCYIDKAEKYVRMHGKTNFGGGGLGQDLFYVWKNYGLVPEEAYAGMLAGEEGHIHGEMDAVFEGYVAEVIKNKNRKLSTAWQPAFEGMVDAYLGEEPAEFTYKGVKYSPESFAASLELNADDYVAIGSFSHHPFYKPFILEIPDNWRWDKIENVRLDEMMSVLDNALKKGYTVCWDADVSEKGFNWGKGVSLIPMESIDALDDLEQAKWSELSDGEKQAMYYDFSKPRKEKVITEKLRQEWFDNYQTTDDHLMLITGMATDKDGNTFYKVKNSWGLGKQIYEGYFYCSEAYMRAKTLFFMVHKDAVPKSLAKKM